MRAFVHGKIDLTQAEAVRDLVEAQTSFQARRAQRQLRGELSRRLAPVKERLLELIVHLESSVEFVDDDIRPDDRTRLSEELRLVTLELQALCSSYAIGRWIVEGATLALAGPPNVGKSSIFNSLLERERAIVTPIPGTTRDLVSERLDIRGIPFRLLDTAGIHATQDPVERIGVERTLGAIADADVVLVVVDAVETTREQCRSLLERSAGLRRVVVVNKIDVCAHPKVVLTLRELGEEPLLISALTGENLEQLRISLVDSVTGNGTFDADDILVSSARHHDLLRRAAEQLQVAYGALDGGLSEEYALGGLHAALRYLGELTGETAVDDILHRIFSTFCIGK